MLNFPDYQKKTQIVSIITHNKKDNFYEGAKAMVLFAKRIFMVDDDKRLWNTLNFAFQRICTTHDGLHAIRCLQEFNPDLALKSIEAGCDDFIFKPLKFNMLFKKSENLLNFHRKKKQRFNPIIKLEE